MAAIVKPKKKVYIVGGPDFNVQEVFLLAGYTGTRELDKADVVVWTGGHDIHPSRYNEKPIDHNFRWYSEARDEEEFKAYAAAPITSLKVGICRGAQLLNITNGGTLWQDVDEHFSTHKTRDIRTAAWWHLNSLHHQMMRPTMEGYVVAVAYSATKKKADGAEWHSDDVDGSKPINMLKWKQQRPDPEVVWYGKTRSLCFQAHPEMGNGQTRSYFYELLKRYDV